MFSWRKANAAMALLSCILWGFATWVGWINSVAFVSHMSMLALVASFIAGWRADVPDKEGEIDN